jgi:CRISPR/Cas system CSM-associated protein Csm3 (group 7 of RAMP superfamily)
MNDRSFTAQLVTTAPVHLGSGETGLATDLPLLRDSGGCPYVPGTHIAGRLREIATRLAPALGWTTCVALDPECGEPGKPCNCKVCRVFGDRRPSDEESGRRPEEAKGDEAHASLVWCFDAPLDQKSKRVRALVRDGVGIDRRTGASAAKAGALYDAEWIPAGTTFRLRVEIEHGAEELAEQVLALALSEWNEGRGRIGGGAARGGGAFRLEEGRFRQANLATSDGLMAFLRAEEPAEDADWLERHVAKLRPASAGDGAAADPLPAGAVGSFARLSFDLAFDGPLLVNDPAVALAHAVSFAPVFVGSEWEKPVLPGSSVRGVLRAQVERIARTLSARKADGLAAFAAACAACDPFSRADGDALRSCADVADADERASEEVIPLKKEPESRCLGCALFGSTRQGSRLWIADAELSGEARFRLRDFVAIDRFTGGALEGAKFDALPLYSPMFGVDMLLWEPAEWELGALALALRDLHDGLATLGAHGSRGFGRAEVRNVMLHVGRVGRRGPVLPDASRLAEPSGVFQVDAWRDSGAGAGAVDLARLAAQAAWTGEFVRACDRTESLRKIDPGRVHDSYFGVTTKDGHRMEDLYPLVVDLASLEVAHGA